MRPVASVSINNERRFNLCHNTIPRLLPRVANERVDMDLLNRVRRSLQAASEHSIPADKRHPIRNSPEYENLRWAAAEEIDALYERIVRELKDDIRAIDSTVEHIAEPMADQLANGAVADVFEAAAEVLKKQIRDSRDGGDSGG